MATTNYLERFGLEPVVNGAGPTTRLGGGPLDPSTVEAMAQMAAVCVPIEELQGSASRVIATLTGAEAGYVTSGAASALTLAAAACICGLDAARMERLPDTEGLANEIIVSRPHRNGYDHALRAAGATLVEVGMDEVAAGAGARGVEPWEIEAAIGDDTVAVAYFAAADALPALEQVAEMARRNGVPLIVDAAAQLPPVANLRSFTAAGADLVAFSGGKAIRAPQSTGILAGPKELVMSAALQCADMDELWELWDPPTELFDRSMLTGLPRHGIGRGFKVAKEELIGLLVALERFAEADHAAILADQRILLETIRADLSAVRGVSMSISGGTEASTTPILRVHLDEHALGATAVEVAAELRRGRPPVHVNGAELRFGVLCISSACLDDAGASVLAQRLRTALEGSARP